MHRRSIILGGAGLALAPGLAIAGSAPIPREPTATEARIVVYRKVRGYAGWRAFTVEIDDVDAIKLNEGQHGWLYLKPGPHKLEVDVPWDMEINAKNKPAVIDFEGGRTYYFKMDIHTEAVSALAYRQIVDVVPVSEGYALFEINEDGPRGRPTKYRAPLPGAADIGAVDR